MAHVVELTSYPIKGCAGVPLTDAELTPAGIVHDRTFLIVDPDGVFRTQRTLAGLAVIEPRVDDTRLTLRAPGTDPLSAEVRPDGPRTPVLLHGNPFAGIDQGDEVAGWITEVAGEPCRLVRVPPDHDRVVGGETVGTSAYADSCAVHLISLLSVDDLTERIVQRGGFAVPHDRFRANVVVDGWSAPYQEDGLRRFEVGDAELGFNRWAVRCVVTTVEQRTGLRDGPEPLRTLAGYRRHPDGGVSFGVKFSVLRPGKLSVGDELAVSAWGGSPWQS